MPFEHITIVGAGAIGSLFGALLSRVTRVMLIGREAHVDAIRRRGLQVAGHSSFSARLDATTDPCAVQGAHLILLTVKANSTAAAAGDIAEHMKPGTPVVLMQNGLGVEDAAQAALPGAALMRGLTYHGVTFPEPGHVIWAGRGPTLIGAPPCGTPDAAQAVAALLNSAGIDTRVSEDIQRDVWEKTLVNIGINALGAITRMHNGLLAEHEHTRALMKRLVEEAQAVAASQGYDFDAFDHVVDMARATGANKNSMLQDIEAGRPTEIDYLNGAVVRLAAAAGLDASCNACVAALVKAIQG